MTLMLMMKRCATTALILLSCPVDASASSSNKAEVREYRGGRPLEVDEVTVDFDGNIEHGQTGVMDTEGELDQLLSLVQGRRNRRHLESNDSPSKKSNKKSGKACKKSKKSKTGECDGNFVSNYDVYPPCYFGDDTCPDSETANFICKEETYCFPQNCVTNENNFFGTLRNDIDATGIASLLKDAAVGIVLDALDDLFPFIDLGVSLPDLMPLRGIRDVFEDEFLSYSEDFAACSREGSGLELDLDLEDTVVYVGAQAEIDVVITQGSLGAFIAFDLGGDSDPDFFLRWCSGRTIGLDAGIDLALGFQLDTQTAQDASVNRMFLDIDTSSLGVMFSIRPPTLELSFGTPGGGATGSFFCRYLSL